MDKYCVNFKHFKHPVHGTFVLSCNCSCLTSFWTQRSQSLHWILMHQPTPTFTSFPIQHRLDASSLQPLSYLFSSLLSPRNTCLHIFNMKSIHLTKKLCMLENWGSYTFMVTSMAWPGNSVSLELRVFQTFSGLLLP